MLEISDLETGDDTIYAAKYKCVDGILPICKEQVFSCIGSYVRHLYCLINPCPASASIFYLNTGLKEQQKTSMQQNTNVLMAFCQFAKSRFSRA